MPRDQCQSVGAYLTDQIDSLEYTAFKVKKDPIQFKRKLKRYGIDAFRIECLMLRFVYDMSYQQIADQIHCPSKWVAYEAVQTGLKLLKEREYK